MAVIHGKVLQTDEYPRRVYPMRDTIAPNNLLRKRIEVIRANQVIWYLLAIIEILLIFRLLLEIGGANPYSGFANFMYSLSYPFVYPFRGVFGAIESGRSVFDWSIFVAGGFYFVLAYILSRLMQIIYPMTPEDVDTTV